MLGLAASPPLAARNGLDEFYYVEKQAIFGKQTLRQQFEKHREDISCAGCHALLDPIGFALENYDAIGRFRELDNGQPIDASGQLPKGETFDDALGMVSLLAQGDVRASAAMLGRPHEVRGVVEHGDKRGRELGFPTANIATASTFGLAQGVYAVRARLGEKLLDGVAAYGKPIYFGEVGCTASHGGAMNPSGWDGAARRRGPSRR